MVDRTLSVDRLKPAFLDADWGVGERPGPQPSTKIQQVPPIPSSASEVTPLLQDKPHTPPRIVKRSRAGREIRPPVKLLQGSPSVVKTTEVIEA